MLKTLAKMCAKFALGYLPDVALWLVKLATTKTSENENAKRALAIVEQLAKDVGKLADVMKDGTVTDTEAEEIHMRADLIAEEIGSLL